MQIVLAKPRGFCAGVNRAVAVVERALAKYGAPVYVRHEIVHNRTVVEELKNKGAVFVEDVADIPEGSVVIFSAHGVSREVEQNARARGLTVIDATCPLVMKVHREVAAMHAEGRLVVMIGHKGHAEVEGTMGQIEGGIVCVSSVKEVLALSFGERVRMGYVTQTTLSIDETREIIEALKSKYPGVTSMDKADICYATQSRQSAVARLAGEVDLFLVIGSSTSSNSNRLRDKALREGVEAHLIDSWRDIDPAWLEGRRRIGITAGASAPEHLVQEVVARLKALGPVEVSEMPGEADRIQFPLPTGV